VLVPLALAILFTFPFDARGERIERPGRAACTGGDQRGVARRWDWWDCWVGPYPTRQSTLRINCRITRANIADKISTSADAWRQIH